MAGTAACINLVGVVWALRLTVQRISAEQQEVECSVQLQDGQDSEAVPVGGPLGESLHGCSVSLGPVLECEMGQDVESCAPKADQSRR